MICKQCGASIPDDSEFCNKCGKKLKQDAGQDKEQTPIEKIAASQDEEDRAAGDGKERDLWEGALSWKAYGHWFLLLVALGVVFLVFFIHLWWFRNVSHLEWVGYPMLIIWLGLFLWLVVVVLRLKLTLKYRLTTQRLFIQRGFLRRTIDEVELIRVDDVTVRQNLVQRMFSVGDLIIIAPTDASDANLALRGIEDPFDVKELVREHARRLRKKSLHVEQL